MGKSKKRKSVSVSGAWIPLSVSVLASKAFASLSPHGTFAENGGLQIDILYEALARVIRSRNPHGRPITQIQANDYWSKLC